MDNTAQNAPAQQPTTPVQPPAQSGQTPVQTGKKKGFPWVLFIIIAVIFLVIGLGAMFFLSQQQKVSYAPPFPKPSPTTTMEKEGTPSATTTISPTITPTGTASPTAKLTPTTTATPSATPTP